MQVKVWFQNRRMKWRHTNESRKSENSNSDDKDTSAEEKTAESKGDSASNSDDEEIEMYTISSDDEIDVGIE